MNDNQEAPLVKGGQGRSDADVTANAEAVTIVVVAAAFCIGLLFFVGGGCSS